MLENFLTNEAAFKKEYWPWESAIWQLPRSGQRGATSRGCRVRSCSGPSPNARRLGTFSCDSSGNAERRVTTPCVLQIPPKSLRPSLPPSPVPFFPLSRPLLPTLLSPSPHSPVPSPCLSPLCPSLLPCPRPALTGSRPRQHRPEPQRGGSGSHGLRRCGRALPSGAGAPLRQRHPHHAAALAGEQPQR